LPCAGCIFVGGAGASFVSRHPPTKISAATSASYHSNPCREHSPMDVRFSSNQKKLKLFPTFAAIWLSYLVIMPKCRLRQFRLIKAQFYFYTAVELNRFQR